MLTVALSCGNNYIYYAKYLTKYRKVKFINYFFSLGIFHILNCIENNCIAITLKLYIIRYSHTFTKFVNNANN